MLLKFTVSNYKSIDKPITLSFEATSGKEFLKENTVFDKAANINVLTSLNIYGPNASGKSNILEALFMFTIAMRSGKSKVGRELDTWPTTPYKFSEDKTNIPTRFELVFTIGNVKYNYKLGFTADEKIEEELSKYVKNRKRKIYSFKRNKYKWGTILQGEHPDKLSALKKVSEWSTNKTLLQAIDREKRNILEEYTKIYSYLSGFICVQYPRRDLLSEITIKYIKEANKKKEIVDFMKSADSSISDIAIVDNKEVRMGVDIYFVYRKDEKEYRVIFQQESAGTKKLFGLAVIMLLSYASENDILLVIDELDASLHPSIIDNLIETFLKNNIGHQLIVSMHYTGFIDKLRRDQIVLTEKNRETLSTEIFTIANFNGIRTDLDIEKAYLKGIFGATPYTNIEFHKNVGTSNG